MRRVCAVALIVSAVTVAGATREAGLRLSTQRAGSAGHVIGRDPSFVEAAEQNSTRCTVSCSSGTVTWSRKAGGRLCGGRAAPMFSLSKSFTSTAVGLAVADSKFTVDDPILNFFRTKRPSSPAPICRRCGSGIC